MKATPQSQGQQLVVYQKKSSSTAGASQKTLSQEVGSSKFFSTYHVSESALNAIMQNELISSIKAHLSDYSHFHKYWMGDVVVLVGTSTAGKTSDLAGIEQHHHREGPCPLRR